jgi:hypothetical protein
MIKDIYTRLRSFFISPFFSLLVVIIILILAYYFLFEPTVYLCDDGTLSIFNLRMNLTNEMAKYRIAQVRYQEAIDTQEHYWK